MSRLMDSIYDKAKSLYKHIVLPEGEEERIINAAKAITERRIAKITLIGREKVIKEKAGCDLCGIEIIDPSVSPKTSKYIDLLYELRKAKGMTRENAEKLVMDMVNPPIIADAMGDEVLVARFKDEGEIMPFVKAVVG